MRNDKQKILKDQKQKENEKFYKNRQLHQKSYSDHLY